MAGNDTAALVVALSAQLTQFEKDMDKAVGTADKGARRIEERFKKINPGTQFLDEFESKLLKIGTAAGLAELVAKFAELNEQTAKIGELSETIGVNTDRFQQFRFAVIAAGGSVDEADSFLLRFSRSVAEAATGTGNLANFLRVNNINAQQFAKLPLDQQLSRYGQLLTGASTQQEKLNNLFFVGGRQAGPNLLQALQTLGGGWDETATAAAKAGTVIEKDFIERAKASAEKWRVLKLQFTVNSEELAVSTWELLSRTIANAAGFLGSVLDKLAELRKQSNIKNSSGPTYGTAPGVGYVPGLEVIPKADPTVDELQKTLDALQSRRDSISAAIASQTDTRTIQNLAADLDAINQKITATRANLSKLVNGTPDSRDNTKSEISSPLPVAVKDARTSPAAVEDDGSTKQYNAQADAISKLLKAQQDRIDLLNAENQSIGKSIYDSTYLTEKIKLEAEARKLNNDQKLGPSQLAQIDEEAKKIAAATVALDAHKRAWAGVNSAIQFAGDQAIDVMDGLRNGTLSASDAVKQLGNAFIHAAEQALLLGSGPLANLFGTQSATPGGTGGILGALTGIFRANGGSVSAGEPYIVGEQGPEFFVPKSAGSIVPNGVSPGGGGGTSVSMNVSIDARGADQAAVIRIGAGLDQLQRTLPAKVATIVKTQQKRGTRP